MSDNENITNQDNETINNDNQQPISAINMAKKTTFILLCFCIAFIGFLAVVFQNTQQKILVAEEKEKFKFINEILPKNLYDNNLSATMIELFANNSYALNLQNLGIKKAKESSKIFFAEKNHNLEFIIFEFSAIDGYGASPIHLVLATNLQGKIRGVRVISHTETPGLSDYIEVAKSDDKKNAWIFQFNNLAINGDDSIWKVQKDGGNLWYKSGATVSARAISKAVKNAMLWFDENKSELIEIHTKNTKNTKNKNK